MERGKWSDDEWRKERKKVEMSEEAEQNWRK